MWSYTAYGTKRVHAVPSSAALENLKTTFFIRGEIKTCQIGGSHPRSTRNHTHFGPRITLYEFPSFRPEFISINAQTPKTASSFRNAKLLFHIVCPSFFHEMKETLTYQAWCCVPQRCDKGHSLSSCSCHCAHGHPNRLQEQLLQSGWGEGSSRFPWLLGQIALADLQGGGGKLTRWQWELICYWWAQAWSKFCL